MELKLTEEELKDFRQKNTRFREAESELSHVTALEQRYKNKKAASLANYEMSISALEQIQEDLSNKYNTEGKTGFRVSLEDGSVTFLS